MQLSGVKKKKVVCERVHKKRAKMKLNESKIEGRSIDNVKYCEVYCIPLIIHGVAYCTVR